MKVKSLISSVAAVALLASASAQAAAPASARVSSDVEGEQLFGGGFLIPVLVVIAVGLGLYFALDDGDDEPTSP